MSFAPEISIVIPTHMNPKGVTEFLKSLESQQGLDWGAIEVLVVSNLPDKGLEKYLKKQFKMQVKFCLSGVIGVNAARNTGARLAQGEWIYFVDDDCQFISTEHLERLLELTKSLDFPVAGVGGGYSIEARANLVDVSYLLTCQHWLETSKNDGGNFHLVGGNMCLRRELFTKGYSFNESIKFGGAETELNLRLGHAGFRFEYDKRFNFLHVTNLNLFKLCKKAYLQGMGWGIRRYYGVREMDKENISLGKFLQIQPYSKLAKIIIGFYLWCFNVFYLAGYNFFWTTKSTRLHFWSCARFVVVEIERKAVSFIKKSPIGRFYQAGLAVRAK